MALDLQHLYDPAATRLPLVEAVTATHEAARGLLQGSPTPAGESGVRAMHARLWTAVALLSEHVAAVQASVYPYAVRHVPEGRSLVTAALVATRGLERAMRALEERLGGEARAAGQPADGLAGQVLTALQGCAAAELAVAQAIHAAGPPEAEQRVVARWAALTRRAPTRPHPYGPHSGPAGRVAFRLNSVWDRALDVMDNRSAPVLRAPRARRRLGTWSAWATGGPLESPAGVVAGGDPPGPAAD